MSETMYEAFIPFSGSQQEITTVAEELHAGILAGNEELRKLYSVSRSSFMKALVSKLGGAIRISSSIENYSEGLERLQVNCDRTFTIFLSPIASQLRDNSTIAHEIGHYFLHFNRNVNLVVPESVELTGGGYLDGQADLFAACFLLPEKEFEDACNKYGNNDYLIAAHFEVPTEIVAYRKQNQNGSSANATTIGGTTDGAVRR
jgi:Zn-dependent peptidase ImmA (M78 family)